MRKLLLSLMVLGLALSYTPLAKACGEEPAYCPVRALKHADELKLSDAQKKQLEQIKDEAMKSVQAIKDKVAADTKAVMNAKQLKKYEELKAKKAEGKEGKCDKCPKKDCDGKSCERPDHKEKK